MTTPRRRSPSDRFDVVTYEPSEGWETQVMNTDRQEAWVVAQAAVSQRVPVRVCLAGRGFQGVVWSHGSAAAADAAYRSDEMRAQERAAGVR